MTQEIDDIFNQSAAKKEKQCKCIVRLITTQWSDRRGIHQKKSIVFLKRKSEGYNFLEEDTGMIGANDVIKRIIDFNSYKDGVYEVITCNERSDWETPHIIDDYDYKLIKYEF